MGFKYQGDSTLGVSFTVQTSKPLDSRSVVSKIEDLYTINPKYAYEGMSVTCLENGIVYTLIDKNKITLNSGWKSSIDSIICTQSEYDAWRENTNEDFTPINIDEPYLRPDMFYYIYEDSLTDGYVKYSEYEELKNDFDTLKEEIKELEERLIILESPNTVE